MDAEKQLLAAAQILIALLLGGLIGFEREKVGKAAGIRTYAAVCMGSTLFTVISVQLMDIAGASRVVANIVTGIGFLGVGIIFRDASQVRTRGLTTAATVWATAAVGVAVGYSLYIIAIFCSVIIYFLLAIQHYNWFIKWTRNIRKKYEDTEENHHADE